MRKITFLLTLLLMYVGVTPSLATLVQFTIDTNKAYTIKTNGTYKKYLYQNEGKILRSSVDASSAQPEDEAYYFRFVEVGGTVTSGSQTYTKYYIQPVTDEDSYVYNNGGSIGYSNSATESKKVWFVLHDDVNNCQCVMFANNGNVSSNYWYTPGTTDIQLAGPGSTYIWTSYNALIIEEVPGYEFEEVDQEALNAKKAELNEKIQQAENLLSTSGFSFVPGGNVALQVSNLSSNADHNALNPGQKDGGGLSALLDGNSTTYFHTSWGNNKPSAYHYLQVDLGDANKVSEFLFNYTTRNGTQQGTSPAPTKIEVYAGNSTDNMKLIKTISSGLPSYWPAAQTYQSDVISAGDSYRYLRFQVTGSAGPGNNGYDVGSTHYYFFCMSEFGISLPEQVVVTNDSYLGKEQQLKELNQEVKDAKAVVEENNLQSIEDAITELTTLLNAISPLASINVTLAQISDTDNLLYGLTGYIGSFSATYATELPDGVEAYYATSKDNMGYITLTPCVATGTSAKGVPANFGVILVSQNQNITLNPASGHIDTPANNVFGNSASEAVEMGDNCYVLANGDDGIGFYLATKGTTLKAGKAYIQLPNSSQTSALRLVLDETVTGINGVATEKADAPIYDLSGRRVLNTVKGGIYIQNGKKFIVK